MTSYDDARPFGGRTPFEEELMNAMNQYADSAEAPEFDAPRILRRTRRRRTLGVAAVAAALIAVGTGTALATSSTGGGNSSTPAATSTATGSDATTVLYSHAKGGTVPVDFEGWNSQDVRAYMSKMRTKAEFTKEAVKGCKPGSVIGVSPHAPETVKKGDTITFALCAG